jgi:predicted PurR-regulated permease PerM
LQLFEVLIVRPRVDERTLYVGPALPLIVALIGWEIYGLGGAVYSVLLLILVLAFADAIDIESGEASPTTQDSHAGIVGEPT